MTKAEMEYKVLADKMDKEIAEMKTLWREYHSIELKYRQGAGRWVPDGGFGGMVWQAANADALAAEQAAFMAEHELVALDDIGRKYWARLDELRDEISIAKTGMTCEQVKLARRVKKLERERNEIDRELARVRAQLRGFNKEG